MWVYQKTLQHPVNIKNGDLEMAKYLITQFGGPNGELGAALRYLSQRYTMPTGKSRALLTDIGTEELAHVEIISTMVYQLTSDATPEELKAAGLGYKLCSKWIRNISYQTQMVFHLLLLLSLLWEILLLIYTRIWQLNKRL